MKIVVKINFVFVSHKPTNSLKKSQIRTQFVLPNSQNILKKISKNPTNITDKNYKCLLY